MTPSVTFETKKIELLQSVISIETEAVIDKLAKYLEYITKSEKEDYGMSEEAFYAKIDHAQEQYERGECVAMKEGESIEEFLNRL